MANEAQNQPYDNLLKCLLEHQYAAIIPLLLAGSKVEVVAELTVEMLIPPRRGDRVYKALYKGELHIVHFEYESTANSKVDKRLLIYHALLLEKYDLPILSVLVCLFEMLFAASPLKECNCDGEILSFRYLTLPLWKEDARAYVKRHAVPLYGLLPAMDGTSGDLLLQAFEEMIEFYGKQNELLRDELLCFLVLLRRARRLPEAERLRVERRDRMFDPLLEEDPWVQEFGNRKFLEGELEGEARGELKASRSIFINIVRWRFPRLVEVAKAKAEQMQQLDELNILMEQIAQAADEQAARAILEKFAAS